MNAVPHERGDALLSAHCRSFDPLSPTARERLEEEIGGELARMLVSALAPSGVQHVERSRRALGARPVFAA
jgi:hypothetical protein